MSTINKILKFKSLSTKERKYMSLFSICTLNNLILLNLYSKTSQMTIFNINSMKTSIICLRMTNIMIGGLKKIQKIICTKLQNNNQTMLSIKQFQFFLIKNQIVLLPIFIKQTYNKNNKFKKKRRKNTKIKLIKNKNKQQLCNRNQKN